MMCDVYFGSFLYFLNYSERMVIYVFNSLWLLFDKRPFDPGMYSSITIHFNVLHEVQVSVSAPPELHIHVQHSILYMKFTYYYVKRRISCMHMIKSIIVKQNNITTHQITTVVASELYIECVSSYGLGITYAHNAQ